MKSILQTGTSFDLPMRSRGPGKSPSNQIAQNAQNRRVRGKPHHNTFIKLLGAFEKAPLLRYYDPEKLCQVETDASDVALGGILS